MARIVTTGRKPWGAKPVVSNLKQTDTSTKRRQSTRTKTVPLIYASQAPIATKPTSKKKRTPKKASVKVGRVTKKAKTPSASAKTKATKSVKDVQKTTADVKKKRHLNDKLIPNLSIKEYLKDPTIEMKEDCPFISVEVNDLMVIRAVVTDDAAFLKRLFTDTKRISSINRARCLAEPKSALHYALQNENWKITTMLLDNMHSKKPQVRVQPAQSLMQRATTGHYNFHMLGHAVRQINMGRGGREGNNALLKSPMHRTVYQTLMENDTSVSFIDKLIAKGYGTVNVNRLCQEIYLAVRNGHRKLAVHLMNQKGSYMFNYFNDLHRQVLANDKQELKTFRTVSVKKKGGRENKDITPLHCASINPNAKYLSELMAVEPDFNAPDANGWRSVHYASACEGTGPLELLFQKGASPYDVDKQGINPLHVAAQTGRLHNVKILIKKFKENDPTLAALNQKTRFGLTALHLACEKGYLNVVKELANAGADVELQASAGKDRTNALMIASQHGHLDIVKYLFTQHNVIINKRDKLKRTALVHATMNGMAQIVSYLLRVGGDAELPDSSGNTPAHYAAAYGWHFCLKLLMDSGANMNQPNDWQMTPLAVAYLKGHMGLVDILLNLPGIDVDCKDDKGMTLVIQTINAGVDEDTIGQLKYLIKDKGASSTIADSMGNSALHHLVAASSTVVGDMTEVERENRKLNLEIEIAKLLFSFGVETSKSNEQLQTPLSIAISNGKFDLANFLLNNGSELPDELPLENTENALHTIAKKCDKAAASLLFKNLMKQQPKVVSSLLGLSNPEGYTPFLVACQTFQSHSHNEDKQLAEHLKNVRNFLQELLLTDQGILKHRVGTINVDHKKTKHGDEEEDEEMEWEDEEEEDDDDDDGEEKKANVKQSPSKNESEVGRNALHIILRRTGKEPGDFTGGQTNKRPMLSFLLGYKTKTVLECKETDTGFTPLLVAINSGDEEAIELLLKNNADPNAATPPRKEEDEDKTKKPPVTHISALMAAVLSKLQRSVKNLLQFGANVKHRDSEKNVALHYAARSPFSETMVDIMGLLLPFPESVNSQNNRGRSPLHIACNADTGMTDISTEGVEMLLRKGADPLLVDDRGRIPLHYAFVKIGDHKNNSNVDPIGLVSVLLKNMSASSAPWNIADWYGNTPLHSAARRGSNICAMRFLRNKGITINAKNSAGNTALGIAVINRHKASALTMLQANADIHIPFHQGVEQSLEDFKKKNGWKWGPTRNAEPEPKVTGISSAVIQNEWQGVLYIILDLMEKDQDAIYWLLKSAIQEQKYNLALTLLRMGRSVVKKKKFNHDEQDNLVFCLADTADRGKFVNLQKKLVDELTAADVDVEWNSRLNYNNHLEICCKPAFRAANRGNIDLLKIFRDAFQATNGTNLWSHLQTKDGEHNLLSSMLSEENRDQWTQPDTELLDFMKELVDNGCEANVMASFPIPADPTDPKGLPDKSHPTMDTLTPLIRAIQSQHFELVKYFLVKLKMNPNFNDKNGTSPLCHAVSTNNINIVKLLLNYDYDPFPNRKIRDNSDRRLPIHKKRALGFRVLGGMNFQNNDEEDEEEEEEEEEEEQEEEEEEEEQDDEEEQEEEEEEEEEEEKEEEEEEDGNNRKRKKKSKAKKSKKSKKSNTPEQFKKTSPVGLNSLSYPNRNPLFYCVHPFLKWGKWESAAIAKLLLDCGTVTQEITSTVATVRDDFRYIARHGKYPTPESSPFTLAFASSNWYLFNQIAKTDIETDAAAFLKQEADRRQKEAQKVSESEKQKKRLKPHPNSGYMTTGDILICSETGVPFKVLLNKVDVQYGMYGFYNFYILQLVKRRGSELYVVFTSWGRIGDEGQFQRTAFGNLQDAVKEYKAIFRSKTGTDWTNIKTFQNQAKKYRLVQQASNDFEASDMTELDFELERKDFSHLPKDYEAFIRNISDVAELQRKTRQVSSQNMLLPFGRIERDVVIESLEVLQEIGKILEEIEKLTQKSFSGEPKNVEHILGLHQQLSDLSNQFYHLIPFGGMENSQLSVIGQHDWQEWCTTVEALLEFEITGKILCGAAFRKSSVHPIDYIYRSLDIQMDLLNCDHEQAQTIMHYICNSSPKTTVTGIFAILNEEQQKSFASVNNKDGSRMMLWHGTKGVNLISILKLGLRAAPPHTYHTGHLFGKGIYTADVFSKSVNYCQSIGKTSTKYMLLCEVALGKMYDKGDVYDEKLPKGYNSLKIHGEQAPDPDMSIVLPTGAILPLGSVKKMKPKKNQYFPVHNNEYVVYDPRRVIVRYIVAFK